MEIKHLSEAGAIWLISKIKTALGQKVDKQDGKALSTNDLTNELKTKYDNAATKVSELSEAGGEPNKIDTISVNGTDVAPDEHKNVEITVPTTETIKTQIEKYGYQTAAQVNTIITGKGYQTAAQVTSAITAALDKITGIEYSVVTVLPTTGKKGVIYLVAHSHGTKDIYDEYVWLDGDDAGKFEKIGNTDVDLSSYVKAADIVDLTVQELEAMWTD